MSAQDIEDIVNPRVQKWSQADAATREKALEIYPPPKAMQSLKYLYRIGLGPSSSHTMGPRRAALRFLRRNPECRAYKVTLYGALAATGKGHMTDKAIIGGLQGEGASLNRDVSVSMEWKPATFLSYHPNAMKFLALDREGKVVDEYLCFSVGGGALVDANTEGGPLNSAAAGIYEVYPFPRFNDIVSLCMTEGVSMPDIVFKYDTDIRPHLEHVWQTMQESMAEGLRREDP
ncbi:hypothetical protein KIPB_011026, partial [Kipferlia bialata]|eukprot:g11026.t1